MTRFVSAISILLVGGVLVARSQQSATNVLADADKSSIIESVLDLEVRNQTSITDFANIREVSSENVEFIEPSRFSSHGFKVVSAGYLDEAKLNHVVEYLLFTKITFRDGVAVVSLSRVTQGRPCFGPPFSRERSYTYESRRISGRWVAQLISRPAPAISFGRTRLTSKR